MAKLVYLSGPMSDLPDHNFPAFDAMAGSLRGAGFHVINPAELSRKLIEDYQRFGLEPQWADHIAHDLATMRIYKYRKDTICAQLSGWEDSDGATAEHALAVKWGWGVVAAQDLLAESEKAA